MYASQTEGQSQARKYGSKKAKTRAKKVEDMQSSATIVPDHNEQSTFVTGKENGAMQGTEDKEEEDEAKEASRGTQLPVRESEMSEMLLITPQSTAGEPDDSQRYGWQDRSHGGFVYGDVQHPFQYDVVRGGQGV